MIFLCPYCGHKLSRMLVDGISSCDNCTRVFDTSIQHTMLAASWAVRKWHLSDPEAIQHKFDLPLMCAEFVCEHVGDNEASHDDFIRLLDSEKDRFTTL